MAAALSDLVLCIIKINSMFHFTISIGYKAVPSALLEMEYIIVGTPFPTVISHLRYSESMSFCIGKIVGDPDARASLFY